jgi:MFS family permease
MDHTVSRDQRNAPGSLHLGQNLLCMHALVFDFILNHSELNVAVLAHRKNQPILKLVWHKHNFIPLLKIDPESDTTFYGWVVSVFSIGQLVASPFFGFLANKLKSHKIPMLLTLFITLMGNTLYFYLEDTGRFDLLAPRIWMLIARFVMGLGAGNLENQLKEKNRVVNRNRITSKFRGIFSF